MLAVSLDQRKKATTRQVKVHEFGHEDRYWLQWKTKSKKKGRYSNSIGQLKSHTKVILFSQKFSNNHCAIGRSAMGYPLRYNMTRYINGGHSITF